MLSNPLISVIVPVFNASNTLESCLSCIANQSYYNIEVIVIDDGSSDGSNIICDNWREKDKRFKIIHNVNFGSGYSRNLGITLSRGKYLCFVDSDDTILPQMLSELVPIAEAQHTEILFFNYYNDHYNENGIIHTDYLSGVTFSVNGNDQFQQYFSDLIENHYLFIAWNKLYLRSFVNDIGAKFSTSVIVGEDMFFVLPLYREANVVSAVPTLHYRYSIRDSSLLHSHTLSRFHDASLVYEFSSNLISEWNPVFLTYFADDFLNQINSYVISLFEKERDKQYIKNLLKQMLNSTIVRNSVYYLDQKSIRKKILTGIIRRKSVDQLFLFAWGSATAKKIIKKIRRT